MCFTGSPPKPPKPPQTEMQSESAVSDARAEEARRRRATAGYSKSLLTGGAGITSPATTAPKTLLGA